METCSNYLEPFQPWFLTPSIETEQLARKELFFCVIEEFNATEWNYKMKQILNDWRRKGIFSCSKKLYYSVKAYLFSYMTKWRADASLS